MGSNDGAKTDDLFATLFSQNSPQTILLSAANDVGGINAFAHTVATGIYSFWFGEESLGKDAFKLTSAQLDIYGTPAAVPLPAGGLLLMGTIGGLAALRRKRRA